MTGSLRVTDYLHLPARNGNGDVHLVVETPRGASAKFKFEPALQTFLYSRPLAHGIVYPFDWGFIPATCAPDGDPLDGMILHGASSPQGVVVPCRAIAVLEVEQAEDGQTRRNDRLLFAPAAAARQDEPVLSESLKRELCQFFQASVFGTKKKLERMRWNNAGAALATLEQAIAKFAAGR